MKNDISLARILLATACPGSPALWAGSFTIDIKKVYGICPLHRTNCILALLQEEKSFVAIKYISADLLENRFGTEAFGHGCNLQGSMGAGIAKSFKERHLQMYQECRRRCKAQLRRFNLGDSLLWKEEGKTWVSNLGTQEHYWRTYASYEAIEAELEK